MQPNLIRLDHLWHRNITQKSRFSPFSFPINVTDHTTTFNSDSMQHYSFQTPASPQVFLQIKSVCVFRFHRMLKESPLLPFSSQPIFYRAECITVSGFFSVELPSPPKAGFKTQGNFSGCEDVSHGQLAPEKAAPLIPVPSFFCKCNFTLGRSDADMLTLGTFLKGKWKYLQCVKSDLIIIVYCFNFLRRSDTDCSTTHKICF